VTDGRTVGQTESIMAKTALCIASYADALSKIHPNVSRDHLIKSFFPHGELFQNSG